MASLRLLTTGYCGVKRLDYPLSGKIISMDGLVSGCDGEGPCSRIPKPFFCAFKDFIHSFENAVQSVMLSCVSTGSTP